MQRLQRLFWSERRDLNPGPPVPQTGALTGLRYAPPRKITSTPARFNAQGHGYGLGSRCEYLAAL